MTQHDPLLALPLPTDGPLEPPPDWRDLARTPDPHLTFGAGAHSCLGQSLARTELQVALEVLQRKLPSVELAVPVAELQQVDGLTVGGRR